MFAGGGAEEEGCGVSACSVHDGGAVPVGGVVGQVPRGAGDVVYEGGNAGHEEVYLRRDG